MTYITTAPEAHAKGLWTIDNLLCGAIIGERPHYDISIFVSNIFLDAAQKTARLYSKEQICNGIKMLLEEMNWDKMGPEDVIAYDKYGIFQITHSIGDGVWLSLHSNHIDEYGCRVTSYNCDTAYQQSFLLRIWVWWASIVEMQLEDGED